MAKFAKGVSGNPGGRPSGVGDLRGIARRHTGVAVQAVVQVMGDWLPQPLAQELVLHRRCLTVDEVALR